MRPVAELSYPEVLARFRSEARLRQRAAVLLAACVFFGGLLVALGLGRLLLGVVGLLVVVAATGSVSVMVKRRALSTPLHRWRSAAVSCAGRLAGQARSSAIPTATVIVRSTGNAAAGLATRLERVRAPRSPAAASKPEPQAVEPVEEVLYGWPYAGADPLPAGRNPAAPKPDDARRRALELNARGAQLRRSGEPARAVALHLDALSRFESLQDRHACAATLNSLALAFAAAGDTDAAVERFEQSLLLLRDSEDAQEEGKVVANLGFALLQKGADDRGRRLLNEALEKLQPESAAAQQVEARLRRAG